MGWLFGTTRRATAPMMRPTKIAEKNPHLYHRDIERIVNTVLDEIINALKEGDRVERRRVETGALHGERIEVKASYGEILKLAVSRTREFLADASAVQFTRNPTGLISALGKLAEKAAPFPGVSRATQHLFIVNPVQTFTAKTPALLATHPDIEDRIARLRNLGG